MTDAQLLLAARLNGYAVHQTEIGAVEIARDLRDAAAGLATQPTIQALRQALAPFARYAEQMASAWTSKDGSVFYGVKRPDAAQITYGDFRQAAAVMKANPSEPLASSERGALAKEFDGEAKAHRAMGDYEEARKCEMAAAALRDHALDVTAGALALPQAVVPDTKQPDEIAAHTPTPWTFDHDWHRLPMIFGADGYKLAIIEKDRLEAAKANAAFIIEAVNNYDALRTEIEEQRAWHRLATQQLEYFRAENGVLRDMLINPDPDQESDNVRLHRERCDMLDRSLIAEAHLANARKALEEIDKTVSEFERIMLLPNANELKQIWNVARAALAQISPAALEPSK